MGLRSVVPCWVDIVEGDEADAGGCTDEGDEGLLASVCLLDGHRVIALFGEIGDDLLLADRALKTEEV